MTKRGEGGKQKEGGGRSQISFSFEMEKTAGATGELGVGKKKTSGSTNK